MLNLLQICNVLQQYYHKTVLEAGCDEAGRGCYAGPVFAAAVILPKDYQHPLLNDSKKMTEKRRLIVREDIELNALAYAVEMVSEKEIDRTNILKASFKAMHNAIGKLNIEPEMLLIDGNRFPVYAGISHICIVKGDSIYTNIAAASVLAKTYRDEYMMKLDSKFPEYNWQKNKGYGTADHRGAIEKYGLCEHHRKSFNILPMQTELF